MTAASIVAFWGVSALFVVTPGADWAYAIAASGRGRSPLAAVLGMLAGHLLATLAVSAGVGALVASVPGALTALTVAGAVYLIWLGIGLLRAPAPTSAAAEAPPRPIAQALRGLAVSGLNPKVLLLFLALMPQFTDPAGAVPLGIQILLLGLVHIATCAVVYLLVGFGARRAMGARPRLAGIVSRGSGAIMVVIGAALAVERLMR